MKLSQLKKSQFAKSVLKIAPQWSRNTVFIVIGIFLGIIGVGIVNPGHIVQKSLNLVGIETDTEQTPLSESDQTAQANQIKTDESGDTAAPNSEGSDKKDDPKTSSTPKKSPTEPEPTGSHTVITPEDIQTHKDNNQPLLIAKQDWDVKVNSRLPSSCGTSSSPCSVGQQAKVNVSAYNTHTNELLPITECNGVVNKPGSFSDATTTTLVDNKHCEITYTPSQAGMYRLQIELYLSKSVYTDTIYWGGWVWGTDSPNTNGYFVQ